MEYLGLVIKDNLVEQELMQAYEGYTIDEVMDKVTSKLCNKYLEIDSLQWLEDYYDADFNVSHMSYSNASAVRIINKETNDEYYVMAIAIIPGRYNAVNTVMNTEISDFTSIMTDLAYIHCNNYDITIPAAHLMRYIAAGERKQMWLRVITSTEKNTGKEILTVCVYAPDEIEVDTKDESESDV